ncbi:MAG: hypothetical protein QNI87_03215 [Erythrobacter sp.]|uniref:hypothetical protein n=1 Tax=Erythrobacter sp. TaxID=1042 RepID=UPI0026257D60|nr:hypothetical protein [Erythrobacter sp.]MDJ0977521.1 hypothetical protein [Erythrobacter sp.]
MRRTGTRLAALLLALAALCAVPLAPARAAANDPGRVPEKVSRASALDPGHGAVIVSVRSELFLLAELNVWFLREGGDIANEADLIRVSRKESSLSMGGNSTTKYKPLAVQLPAGRYRLVGHGAKCEKVPAPNERCLADVKFAGIGETVSFPSRGYDEGSPVFEVREGELTVAGDFGLTARNTLEWSEIPPEKLGKIARKFASLPRAPAPEVAEDYRLKYPLRPRSYNDDRGRRY